MKRRAPDWKRSRISVLQVEAVPQSCIPSVQICSSIPSYMGSLLLLGSFGLETKQPIYFDEGHSKLLPF
jgi:hypothetical protein